MFHTKNPGYLNGRILTKETKGHYLVQRKDVVRIPVVCQIGLFEVAGKTGLPTSQVRRLPSL